jgi:hypothetical protein
MLTFSHWENANQNYTGFHLPLVRKDSSKEISTKNGRKDTEVERNTCSLLVRM